MTKRLLQQLVRASYKNDSLSQHIIEEVSGRLDKKDLKAYIRALKLMEQKKKVIVVVPKANLYNTSKKYVERLFPKKQLVFKDCPDLLLGMQVIDNDMVYEMNLKDRLENVLDEIAHAQ